MTSAQENINRCPYGNARANLGRLCFCFYFSIESLYLVTELEQGERSGCALWVCEAGKGRRAGCLELQGQKQLRSHQHLSSAGDLSASASGTSDYNVRVWITDKLFPLRTHSQYPAKLQRKRKLDVCSIPEHRIQSLVAIKRLKSALPDVYVGGKVKLFVRNVSRTLLPSRHYKFFPSPHISFAGNRGWVQ